MFMNGIVMFHWWCTLPQVCPQSLEDLGQSGYRPWYSLDLNHQEVACPGAVLWPHLELDCRVASVWGIATGGDVKGDMNLAAGS